MRIFKPVFILIFVLTLYSFYCILNINLIPNVDKCKMNTFIIFVIHDNSVNSVQKNLYSHQLIIKRKKVLIEHNQKLCQKKIKYFVCFALVNLDCS